MSRSSFDSLSPLFTSDSQASLFFTTELDHLLDSHLDNTDRENILHCIFTHVSMASFHVQKETFEKLKSLLSGGQQLVMALGGELAAYMMLRIGRVMQGKVKAKFSKKEQGKIMETEENVDVDKYVF